MKRTIENLRALSLKELLRIRDHSSNAKLPKSLRPLLAAMTSDAAPQEKTGKAMDIVNAAGESESVFVHDVDDVFEQSDLAIQASNLNHADALLILKVSILQDIFRCAQKADVEAFLAQILMVILTQLTPLLTPQKNKNIMDLEAALNKAYIERNIRYAPDVLAAKKRIAVEVNAAVKILLTSVDSVDYSVDNAADQQIAQKLAAVKADVDFVTEEQSKMLYVRTIKASFSEKHPLLAAIGASSLTFLFYAAVISATVACFCALIALTGGGAAAAFLAIGAAALVSTVGLSAVVTAGVGATIAVAGAMVVAASCVIGALAGAVGGLAKYCMGGRQPKRPRTATVAPNAEVDASAIQRGLDDAQAAQSAPGLRHRQVPQSANGDDLLMPIARDSAPVPAISVSANKNSGFGRAVRQWTSIFSCCVGGVDDGYKSTASAQKLKTR